jgi:serine/threonine protein kinase
MLIHSKNILHRDLKLQNMFLAKDNTLKLGDFGVARELEETSGFASTMCGTPYYMAPEVWRGEPYNSKADIFALGIALYELCTFELPFADETMPGLFDKIVNQQPPPILGDYDEDCKNVIIKMLSKDPNNRPSVLELFHTEFIHEKVTSWCLADPKIRAYVEGMVNVKKPMQTQVKEIFITTKESPNYFCENPTILVAELMANLTIKYIKTSYFSAPEPVFSGVDMYNCLKRVKGFGVENENLVEQMCSF